MKYVRMSYYESNSISYGGSNNSPYAQSVSGSDSGMWVVVWERYVPEQGEQ